MASQRKGRRLFPSDERRPSTTPPVARTSPDPTVTPEHLQDWEPAEEDLQRTTVYLTLDQLDHLDNQKILIRRSTRCALDRTAIVRGVLEGFRRSGIDLASLGVRSEGDIARHVLARLTEGEG